MPKGINWNEQSKDSCAYHYDWRRSLFIYNCGYLLFTVILC